MDNIQGDSFRPVEEPGERTAARLSSAPREAREAPESRESGHAGGQGATFAELDLGGTESHQRASFSDPVAPEEVPGTPREPGEG